MWAIIRFEKCSRTACCVIGLFDEHAKALSWIGKFVSPDDLEVHEYRVVSAYEAAEGTR